MARLIPTEYTALLHDVKERIRSAQYEALKVVNKELIGLYWDIGRMIVERQKDESWGRSVVERLANDLQKDFPGIKGFSARNMWYMRSFYSTYAGKAKLQPLVAEIVRSTFTYRDGEQVFEILVQMMRETIMSKKTLMEG